MPAAAGPLVGVAWWLVAPTARVRVVSGPGAPDLLVAAPGVPELEAAQDGTLALLALAAGLVTGVVVALRSGQRPAAATVLAGLGALLGSAAAVAVGQALGPEPLAAQGATAPEAARAAAATFTSPLALHAPAVVLVWPAVALGVAALGHAVAARLSPLEPPPDPPAPAVERPPPTSAAPGPAGRAPRRGRGDRR